ncbi:ATP-binding protein [Streptomyces sp. NPDC046862]|uniref:ATP-binding protein n=1 Tax=Streptomyces sp. NPDC046862 TaxID=3154603 RepID=UPI003456E541
MTVPRSRPRPRPRPRMKGYPGYRLTADHAPETAEEARRLARVALAMWGLDNEAETAALVMSELVANAVRHAHGPRIRLTVNRPALDRVYLAVTDRSPDRHPALLTPRRTPSADAGSSSSTPSPTGGASTSSAPAPATSPPPKACGQS